MHDGDHDILGSNESHDHDHDHDHSHGHDHDTRRKSDRIVKVIAGLVSIGLVAAFVLWKLI